MMGRVRQRERTLPIIRERFKQFDKAGLMARLEATGLPFAPIAKPEELFDDPHLNAAGGLVPVTLPDGRATKLPALPISMDGQRFGLRHDLPQIGADGRALLLARGLSAADIDALVAQGVLAA
jgi:crotonobetainyl-CoA:carnitine CoA-transferase CaiB-like acyl-CoA transferase